MESAMLCNVHEWTDVWQPRHVAGCQLILRTHDSHFLFVVQGHDLGVVRLISVPIKRELPGTKYKPSISHKTAIMNFGICASVLIFVLASIAKSSAEITFVSTKNLDLSPVPFPDLDTSFGDIADLVSTTDVYKTIFSPPRFDSRNPDKTTALVPLVELVRGSNVTSSETTQPSAYGFVGTVLEAFANHHNLAIRPMISCSPSWLNSHFM